MKMTAERLAELRAKAEAATPGPWEARVFRDHADTAKGRVFFRGDEYPQTNTRDCHLIIPDAEHIAAFDPPTVLALLDEIARLKGDAELAKLKKKYERLVTAAGKAVQEARHHEMHPVIHLHMRRVLEELEEASTVEGGR
jgi:hypothetical protein